MAASAAGIGRAYVARVVQGNHRDRRNTRSTAYIEPRDFAPSSTADLWRAAPAGDSRVGN